MGRNNRKKRAPKQPSPTATTKSVKGAHKSETTQTSGPHVAAPSQLTIEKNKGELISKDYQETLEGDLSCAICHDVYINPLMLNCSHSFCKFCVVQWLSKQTGCPQCRMKVTFQGENLALRNIISKMVQKSTQEFRENRTKTVNQRLIDEAAQEVDEFESEDDDFSEEDENPGEDIVNIYDDIEDDDDDEDFESPDENAEEENDSESSGSSESDISDDTSDSSDTSIELNDYLRGDAVERESESESERIELQSEEDQHLMERHLFDSPRVQASWWHVHLGDSDDDNNEEEEEDDDDDDEIEDFSTDRPYHARDPNPRIERYWFNNENCIPSIASSRSSSSSSLRYSAESTVEYVTSSDEDDYYWS